MRWADKLMLRLRSLLCRPQVEHELDAELRFHIEQQIEENLAAGMSAKEGDGRHENFAGPLVHAARLRIIPESRGYQRVACSSMLP
jgi:hypothetical protein